MNTIIQNLFNEKPMIIVALGDSLTQGYMVEKGYLDFFAEMLKRKFPKAQFSIINKGIPGDTALGGLHRLENDVLAYNPDLVFIEFGLNDAFLGVAPLEFAQTIQQIIDKIRERSQSRIMLITSVCLENKRENDLMKKFYDSLDLIARENDLHIARVHSYWQKKIDNGYVFADLVLSDGIHPNSTGYKLMAEEIFKAFIV